MTAIRDCPCGKAYCDGKHHQRSGCCESWPKPCSYHEGYNDGVDSQEDLIARLKLEWQTASARAERAETDRDVAKNMEAGRELEQTALRNAITEILGLRDAIWPISKPKSTPHDQPNTDGGEHMQTDRREPNTQVGNWQELGACRGMDPDIFFPERGALNLAAKRVCAGCEVRQECLDHALDNGEHFGIWGSTSERERRFMRNPESEQRRRQQENQADRMYRARLRAINA